MEFLDALVRTEARFTVFTLAPAMNSITYIARIFHSRFGAAAKWTFHDFSLRLRSLSCCVSNKGYFTTFCQCAHKWWTWLMRALQQPDLPLLCDSNKITGSCSRPEMLPLQKWRPLPPPLLPPHQADFCQRSRSVNVVLHASKHTSTDHDPDHYGRCCMMLSHIYEIATDKWCADRLVIFS